MHAFSKFDKRTYKTYAQLINELVTEGYSDDLSNSSVINALSKCVDDVWARAGNYTGTYVVTEAVTCSKNGDALRVVTKSGIDENVFSESIIYISGSTLRHTTGVEPHKVEVETLRYGKLNYIGVLDLIYTLSKRGIEISEITKSYFMLINSTLVKHSPEYTAIVKQSSLAIEVRHGFLKVMTVELPFLKIDKE